MLFGILVEDSMLDVRSLLISLQLQTLEKLHVGNMKKTCVIGVDIAISCI